MLIESQKFIDVLDSLESRTGKGRSLEVAALS
jgi:hypothetical protein